MRSFALALGWLLVTGWSGCQVPYQPEMVHHPVPLPPDAFDRVLEVVRDRYGRLAESDRAAFRIQSDWLGIQPGDIPGYRRASVFRGEDGRLRVVVEVYFVRLEGEGPVDTPVSGDWRAEQQLAGALERALGG